MQIKVLDPKPAVKAQKFYEKELLKINRGLYSHIEKHIKSNVKNSIIKNDILGDIEGIIKVVTDYQKAQKFIKIVKRWASAVLAINEKSFKDEIKEVKDLTIFTKDNIKKGLSKEVEKRIAYNVSLIVTHDETVKADIRRRITQNVLQGNSTIADEVEKAISKQGTNYKLITRDQTLKFNKELSRVRAIESGVATHFIYRTSHDEKVREEHQKIDKKRFKLKTNNEGNQALNDINCRCRREIIYEI